MNILLLASFTEKNTDNKYGGAKKVITKLANWLSENTNNNIIFVRRNNIKFYIFGPDFNNRYNVIFNIIKDNKLQDCIILNHEIFSDVKVKTLLESDIFIQTSRHEALPLGVFEALSYGLPCLVTVGTSLGEYIEKYNAGWVCETNANSIAECIVRCINEKDLFKTKGQNARKLIEQSFTWDNVAKETIGIYNNLLIE